MSYRMKRPPRILGDIIEIQLTKGMIAIVDAVDIELASLNWCARKMDGNWYAYRYKDIALHREVAARAGTLVQGLLVDHIDNDGLNCRRSNLRPATDTQNRQNRQGHSNSKTGIKGVCRDPGGKWRAEITANGERHYLGLFVSADAAAAAYAEAARALHGDFARLR